MNRIFFAVALFCLCSVIPVAICFGAEQSLIALFSAVFFGLLPWVPVLAEDVK